jgi:hypothetical protein
MRADEAREPRCQVSRRFRFAAPPQIAGGRIRIGGWSMPDPRKLVGEGGPLARAHRAIHPRGPGNADVAIDSETVRVLQEAAEAYLHLTTHPAGTESVVAQLRAVRAALRAAAKRGAR